MIRRKDDKTGPLMLCVDAAPHLGGRDSFAQITRTTLAMAGMAGLAGVALYGIPALKWLTVAVATAVAAEWLYVRLTGGRVTATYDHAALMGLLVGLTLPVGRVNAGGFEPLGWLVPMCAALIAIIVGKGLMGGMGNYMWHPALLGRAGAELLFHEQMHPRLWAVLGRESLFARTLIPARPEGYLGWRASPLPDGANAWALERPLELIRKAAEGNLPTVKGENSLTVLVRDLLPPWEDTLLGGVGGGIGEGCVIALMVGGIYLVYRGYVRWFQPLCVILAAMIAAAVLPVRTGAGAGFDWLPGLAVDGGLSVGLIYVLYHVTSGELMLGAFFLATDMVASPRTVRGQVVFCSGVGALTIALRLYGPMPGSCCWAILIMNTTTWLIDRRTKRRVMGT